MIKCTNCNNLLYRDDVCEYCGLETRDITYVNYNFKNEDDTKTCNSTNRIEKIQNWYNWSKDEKNEYKLNLYTIQYCNKLNSITNDFFLNQNIIKQICDFSCNLMRAIKDDFNGSKRSKVKDGLIIMCIYYILKFNNLYTSYITISKLLNIEIKYISKANKIILQLINNHKLNIPQNLIDSINKIDNPMDYINKIIEKHNLIINPNILDQVSKLINICQDNDILLDHTPLSIGVSCFYYILSINFIEININIFSSIYNISIVTILKTFKKLTSFTSKLEQMGIKCIN